MKAIALWACFCGVCCGQWRVENLVTTETLDATPYYLSFGIPDPTADATFTPLWNGWQFSVESTKACLESPPGFIGKICRTGVASVEFDMVVDTPTEFRWELWRHIEAGLNIDSNGARFTPLRVAGWVDIDDLVMVPAGSYHFRAISIPATEYGPEYVDATLTIPVPEPGAVGLAVAGLYLLAARRRFSR